MKSTLVFYNVRVNCIYDQEITFIFNNPKPYYDEFSIVKRILKDTIAKETDVTFDVSVTKRGTTKRIWRKQEVFFLGFLDSYKQQEDE